MNWLTRLLPGGGGPDLAPEHIAALDALAAQPARDAARSHFETRYVALNIDSGADEGGTRRLMAVGAVAIEHGLIVAGDAFHVRLGDAPVEALIAVVRFIARAPVVVFNAPFNRGGLEKAFEQHLGRQPELHWLDLMVMMPALYAERIEGQARMDAWLGAFGIPRLDPQSALLEALAVAQLFQVALAGARAFKLATPADLFNMENSRRFLRGS